jgi:hypothetical protein
MRKPKRVPREKFRCWLRGIALPSVGVGVIGRVTGRLIVPIASVAVDPVLWSLVHRLDAQAMLGWDTP